MINLSMIALLVLSASHASEYNSKNSVVQRWKEHNEKIENFECSEPQPRSFEWYELKHDDGRPVDKNFFRYTEVLPASTILYRCESAGCCSSGEKCRPKSTDDVALVFAYHDDDGYKHYMTLWGENDTECSCQESSDKPK